MRKEVLKGRNVGEGWIRNNPGGEFWRANQIENLVALSNIVLCTNCWIKSALKGKKWSYLVIRSTSDRTALILDPEQFRVML